jgi:hypothetical protein
VWRQQDHTTVEYRGNYNGTYYIYDLKGTLIQSGNVSPQSNTILLKERKSGSIYLFRINDETEKMLWR